MQNKFTVGFTNGVFDLKNKVFIPNTSSKTTVGYDYRNFSFEDPKVKEVDNLFNQLMTDNNDKQALLKHIASQLDGVQNNKFACWVGAGSNGKSTVSELVRKTFGKYYGVLPSSSVIKNSGLDIEFVQIGENGMRTVFVQEPEYDDVISANTLQTLVNTNKVTCKKLYGGSQNYDLEHKITLVVNKLPDLFNDNPTIRQGLEIFNFKSKFTNNPQKHGEFKADIGIVDKLNDWKEAFMWLLINKYY